MWDWLWAILFPAWMNEDLCGSGFVFGGVEIDGETVELAIDWFSF